MFRNKVVVRAAPPSPSPFLSRLLHLHPPPLYPATSQQQQQLLIRLDSLCWRLSRSLHLSLFFSPSPHAVCVLYKPNQSAAAADAVDRIARMVPIADVGEEEEAPEGSSVAKAVECGLRSFFLNLGWRCVGENCFVESSFSRAEERRHLHAFTVGVQLETSGEILFLVRPDVIRFSRYEIADLIDSKMQQKLSKSEEIILDDYSLATSSSVLPSLSEGHIVGLSKLLPAEVDLLADEENWLVKHGLELPSGHFVNVQFTRGSCTNMSWFPSSFVIQGAGLSPAPQSVRISEAAHVLQSFMACIKDWNFFNEGTLHTKGMVTLKSSELSTWTTAANSIQNGLASQNGNALLTDLFTSSDFRTQKPALLLDSDKRVGELGSKESAMQAKKNGPDVTVPSVHESECISTYDGNSPVAMLGRPSMHTASSPLMPKFSRKAHQKAKESTTSSTTDEHISVPNNQIHITQSSHSDELASQGPLAGFKKKRTNIQKKRSPHNHFSEASTEDVAKHSNEERVQHANVGSLVKDVQRPEDPLSASIDRSALPKIPKARKAKRNYKDAHEDNNKRTSTREKINQKDIPRKKAKLQADSSDSIAKVLDHHKRGQLESVTVVDLKAFLCSRKAKVGGKKEELIQRVTSLLS